MGAGARQLVTENPSAATSKQKERKMLLNQTLGIYPLQTLYQQPLLPIPYVVDGLLAPGLYILGGSPKVGKSWMALQLCLAVSRGVAFLGR